jgi:hypothetical protein
MQSGKRLGSRAGAVALLLLCHPSALFAQHGHAHQDLAIGSDAAGGGSLLLDYPFGERPFVRTFDSGAPEGLFTATDPGFDKADDEPAEGVHAVPAGQEISIEIMAIDEIVALSMNNGVDGPGFLLAPGDTYRVGLISDGECDLEAVPGTCDTNAGLCTAGQVGNPCGDDEECDQGQCTAGNVGANCDEDSECSTLSPDVHNHPEYQLLLLANPDEFAEGRVSFRVFDSDAVAPSYGDSPVYSLTLTNGHLPAPEFEDAADDQDKKRRAKCQRTVTKEVRKLAADHYKRLDKCMGRIVAAEELDGKEEKVDQDCSLDPAGKGVVGRLAEKRAKALAGIEKKCGEPVLDDASTPYTARMIHTHLGMAVCRTQELIAAAYPESHEHLVEHFSGACVVNVCDGGVHAGDACAEDEDCSAEEDVEDALPCLKMSQAAE